MERRWRRRHGNLLGADDHLLLLLRSLGSLLRLLLLLLLLLRGRLWRLLLLLLLLDRCVELLERLLGPVGGNHAGVRSHAGQGDEAWSGGALACWCWCSFEAVVVETAVGDGASLAADDVTCFWTC